jgi:hypothetical protein
MNEEISVCVRLCGGPGRTRTSNQAVMSTVISSAAPCYKGRMDRAALQRRLAQVEAKIAGMQHQIGEQREVIVKLESAGDPAEHAKYLLAGLELLQAVQRANRNAIFAELSKFQADTSS